MALREHLSYPKIRTPLEAIGFPRGMQVMAVHCNGFLLAGPSGGGKTTVGRKIQEVVGTVNINVGDEFKRVAIEKTNREHEGRYVRDPQTDRGIDREMLALMQEYNNTEILLVDARLGPLLTRRSSQITGHDAVQVEQLRYVTILLAAETDERFRRILKRKQDNDPAREYTLDRVKTDTLDRESQDEAQWEATYQGLLTRRTSQEGNLEVLKPFARDITDGVLRNVYDIVISCDYPLIKTPEQIAYEILFHLHVMGEIDLGFPEVSPPR